MTIRVLIADDQALLRGTFRLLLDSTEDMEAVGEVGTGLEAVAALHTKIADVVLMDIRMPDMDGIEATRHIIADPGLQAVRVLVLTTFEHDDLVFEALRAGASGFLGKNVKPSQLLEAIRTVAAGDQLLSPKATQMLVQRFVLQAERTRRADSRVLDALTQRERELVELVATGQTNVEIAESLVLSQATVKTHINRAMAKTGCRDRAQLVVLAYEEGLVVPGE